MDCRLRIAFRGPRRPAVLTPALLLDGPWLPSRWPCALGQARSLAKPRCAHLQREGSDSSRFGGCSEGRGRSYTSSVGAEPAPESASTGPLAGLEAAVRVPREQARVSCPLGSHARNSAHSWSSSGEGGEIVPGWGSWERCREEGTAPLWDGCTRENETMGQHCGGMDTLCAAGGDGKW